MPNTYVRADGEAVPAPKYHFARVIEHYADETPFHPKPSDRKLNAVQAILLASVGGAMLWAVALLAMEVAL